MLETYLIKMEFQCPNWSKQNNWQQKNPDSDIEKENLYIKEIKVDSAGMLKRLRPAPQGRAHRIRKRSNHVTLVLDNLNQIQE